MNTCYLDWAASAPPYEDILRASVDLALERYANTSSGHPAGKAAAASLEEARALFAGAIGAAASLATPFLLPPVLYLASRGNDAAESAVIVAAVCGIFLSYFAVTALVSSIITALTARGKREGAGGADANADGAHGDTGGSA